MPKKQDWLDIMEEASKLKKGTKLPKNFDVYSLTMAMSPLNGGKRMDGGMKPWNTGAGANGVVEPSKAVMLDMETKPPSVYHEGETVYPFPGGKKIVPATTETQQYELSAKQEEKGYPGYQTGGTVYNDPNSNTRQTSQRPTNLYDLSPENQYQQGVNQAFQTTQQRASGTDPLMENIRNRTLQDYDTRAAVRSTETNQGVVSNPYLTEGAKQAVKAKDTATYRAGLSGLVGDLSEASMRRAEEANRELYDMGRTGIQDELTKQRFEKTFGEQQYQTDVAKEQWEKSFDLEKQKYGDQEFQRMADDAQTTSFDTWQQKYPNSTFEDYTRAREYKVKQLEGMDIEIARGWETVSQLRDAGQWAEAKAFLDAGDIQGYANYVKQITGRDLNTEELESIRFYENMMRNYDVSMADVALQAQQLGVRADRLALFIDAVNNGAPIYTANETSGLNLDYNAFNNIRRNYTHEGRLQQAQLEEIQTSLGDQRFNSIVDRINKGATLDMVNDEFGTDFTIEEFNNMRETTLTGQREWERNLGMANMLFQTMDPNNIRQASGVIEDLFPGITFDTDQLIRDIGADRFAQSMQDLATLSNTFSSWDEASRSVVGMNLIQNMGMIGNDELRDRFGDTRFNNILKQVERGYSKDDINKNLGIDLSDDEYAILNSSLMNAKTMFEGLQLNALDEEWSAISESDFFKNELDDDARTLIRQTLTAGLTGELEFDITPSFQVTDGKGNMVQSFDSIADANKFIGENPDSGYSVERKNNYVYKNLLSGDTVIVNNQGDVVEAGKGKNTADLYEEFIDTVPFGEGVPTYSEWVASNKPGGYDQFISDNPINALKGIEIENYSDMLTSDNHGKLMNAWKTDPGSVKASEFYYKAPDNNTILMSLDKIDNVGSRHTAMTQVFRDNINNSIGKYVEMPMYNDKTGETDITGGQLIGYEENPTSVELRIKKEDGTIVKHALLTWGKSGDKWNITVNGETKTYTGPELDNLIKGG